VSGVLIVTPLGIERSIVRSGWRGARVRQTGMGPAKAGAAASWLAREPGDALLVLGFCGGLDAESIPGEVIVATSLYGAADEGHPPERIACAETERIAALLRSRGLTVRSGAIVCVGRIALGARRAQLLADGALAVDMESVWLAPGAGGRPFSVVRVVLDSPSHELLHPRAAPGALRAARALRRVAGALHDWAPGERPREGVLGERPQDGAPAGRSHGGVPGSGLHDRVHED
jgi:4-hydroxy-3-methylbut-2-enyl diphosphate reductase